jgi:hypothetical protein
MNSRECQLKNKKTTPFINVAAKVLFSNKMAAEIEFEKTSSGTSLKEDQ